jgi:hypothetical protein
MYSTTFLQLLQYNVTSNYTTKHPLEALGVYNGGAVFIVIGF